MCIFIFTHIEEAARGIGHCLGTIAKDLPRLAASCGKDLVSCTRSILGFVLLLPGILLGAAFVCAASLLVAAVKLLLGTAIQVDKSIRGYCGVIQRGVDAYQGGAAVPQGV